MPASAGIRDRTPTSGQVHWRLIAPQPITRDTMNQDGTNHRKGSLGTRVLILLTLSLLLAAASWALKQHLPEEQPVDQGQGPRRCDVDAKFVERRADGSITIPKGTAISCERSLSANPRGGDARETVIVKSRS